VLHGAEVETNEAVHDPGSKADEPDPCEIPHRAMMHPGGADSLRFRDFNLRTP
jgi:hypothetical protein